MGNWIPLVLSAVTPIQYGAKRLETGLLSAIKRDKLAPRTIARSGFCTQSALTSGYLRSSRHGFLTASARSPIIVSRAPGAPITASKKRCSSKSDTYIAEGLFFTGLMSCTLRSSRRPIASSIQP
eukprot:scaffold7054_cov400-Pinguiococcus_pyrenoidosus.AAC.6